MNSDIKSNRTPDDYARQQEDIRATQTFGESSLDRGSDRQHHTDRPASSTNQELGRTSEERERGQGVQKGTGKPVEDVIAPKNDRGYDIAPTATNVKL